MSQLVQNVLDFVTSLPSAPPGSIENVVWIAVIAVAMFLSVIIFMAFLTLAERRVIGSMQARIGPNRIKAFGLPVLRGYAQPFADVIKLMLKEIIIPSSSNKVLFLLAPVLTAVPALAMWAIMPMWPGFTMADINAGLLYYLALASTGVYGIILAGWASNSKYAFLGAMRAAAQVVAYELAMGFAIIGVVMASGTLNMGGIIEAQKGAFGSFFWYMPPLFMVYFISGIAETNRAPFDVVEGESEIVAGFHVDYSGMAFALFFVAEYINMILISALTAVFFFGGWMSPLEGWVTTGPAWLIHGSLLWLWLKICFFLFCYLWFRATFPRYRYDQIMRLGWKVFIPITLIWLVVEAVMVLMKVGPWAHMA